MLKQFCRADERYSPQSEICGLEELKEYDE
ncbi:hypothetical protein CLS_15620 [[Clostridium] cf. saccharolyticum K10]|nr:hypothetical protein CLS_15620 [[Clostridium] cf. saccharolyticum K10]